MTRLAIALLSMVAMTELAWANGETLYVRPLNACVNNGNGTAYGCAASNGATGAYNGFVNILYNAANTVGQVDPGDKLYVCGTHTAQQMEIYQDGTVTLPIDIDFGCPGDSGIINPTSQNFALYIEASNVKVHGGVVSRGNLGTLLISTNGGVNTDFSGVEIYSMVVRDCLNVTNECLGYYGTNVYIHDNTITNGANDGIHSYGGANVRIINNKISSVSTGGSSGDCIQLSQISDGTLVEGNTCDHTNVDSKYCIISDSESVPGVAIVKQNVCLRKPTDVIGSGLRANNGTIFIGNTVTGGQYGIQCATPSGRPCDVIGNVILQPNEIGIITGGTNTIDRVLNNTIIGGATGISLGNNVSGVIARNNVLVGNITGLIKLGGSSPIDSHNFFYQILGDTVVANGVPVSPGTGSQVGIDPQFDGATYRTRATSPLRRAGIFYHGCIDVRGRICNSPPDIGALQASPGDMALGRLVRN